MAVISFNPFFKVNQSHLDDYQLHIDLSIDIFKSQNPALIVHLKNFFVYLANPVELENIFKTAVEKLAVEDEQSCRWILRNSDYLLPEIDLIDLAKQMTQTILENTGLVYGQDFKFELNCCRDSTTNHSIICSQIPNPSFRFLQIYQLSDNRHLIKELTASDRVEFEHDRSILFNLIKEEILLLVN